MVSDEAAESTDDNGAQVIDITDFLQPRAEGLTPEQLERILAPLNEQERESFRALLARLEQL